MCYRRWTGYLSWSILLIALNRLELDSLPLTFPIPTKELNCDGDSRIMRPYNRISYRFGYFGCLVLQTPLMHPKWRYFPGKVVFLIDRHLCNVKKFNGIVELQSVSNNVFWTLKISF